MTIPDYTTLHELPRLKVMKHFGPLPNVLGRPLSGWTFGDTAGATPTTAQAVGRTTPGAMASPAPASSRLVEVSFFCSTTFRISGVMIDRLSHQGGLVANIATLQNTNLPTAALTRYTDGEGVWIGLEIYATIGNTQVIATVTYTNQAGVGGRIGICQLGSTGGYTATGLISVVALQAGDTGARSVESVQLSATTGIAGSFGVTLFRPLSPFSTLPGVMMTSVWHNTFGGCFAVPPIDPDACLMPIFYALSSTTGFRGEFAFVEG